MYADTLDVSQLDTTVVNYDIDRVVHFSALLSAVAEANVARGLQVFTQRVVVIQNIVIVSTMSLCYKSKQQHFLFYSGECNWFSEHS